MTLRGLFLPVAAFAAMACAGADGARLTAGLFEALDPAAFGGKVDAHSVAEHFRRRAPQPGFDFTDGYDREQAERAATGRMREVNIDWTFPDGRVDWLFDPTAVLKPVNHEWVWQLNRMSFWRHLCDAYRATGDERWARAFRDQLRGWIAQTDCPEDYNGPGSAWRTIEAGIRLFGSWPEAFETFRASPTLTDEDLCLFVGSMLAQARHLMAHRTERNWLLMEMNGVYTFATRFPELKDARRLRIESAKIFADAIRSQVLPDGYHDELSPDYHSVFYGCASRIFFLNRIFDRRGELPADYAAVLERAAQAYVDMMTPGFTMPRANDCYTMHVEWVLSTAAEMFPERKDFLWGATHGKRGEPPAGKTASRLLPWAGYCAMRTGWDREATFLSFDFGPLGEAHHHQDKLNVNLYKGGEELVFDDGGGQYEVSPERAYGQSGYDHNTLLVDGLSQCRREPKRYVSAADVGWESTPDRDHARATYDQGFGPDRLRLAVHTRDVVLDKRADTVTLTDVVKSADGAAHDYELLFQLDTTNTVIAADGRSLRARFGRKWDLVIESRAPDTRITTAVAQKAPRLAGWFLGRNDMRNHPATTVTVSGPHVADFVFRTVLRPVTAEDRTDMRAQCFHGACEDPG